MGPLTKCEQTGSFVYDGERPGPKVIYTTVGTKVVDRTSGKFHQTWTDEGTKIGSFIYDGECSGDSLQGHWDR
jgi:hypothetical protein